MAWTAPRTWTTNEVVTSSMMNTHVRDNFLETSPATASAAGDIVYADAANSMGLATAIVSAPAHLTSDGSGPVWRRMLTDSRTDSATGTPTVWNTLGGVNWYNDASQVEVSTTTGTNVLVIFRAMLSNNTAGALTYVSYGISGATTSAGDLTRAIGFESSAANDRMLAGVATHRSGLTAGTNVFTLVGLVSAGIGKIEQPSITVLPF